MIIYDNLNFAPLINGDIVTATCKETIKALSFIRVVKNGTNFEVYSNGIANGVSIGSGSNEQTIRVIVGEGLSV